MEIAKALEERKSENVYVIYEENQLHEKIMEALEHKGRQEPTDNIGKENLIGAIRTFIETGQC
jgi:hypothetical protein